MKLISESESYRIVLDIPTDDPVALRVSVVDRGGDSIAHRFDIMNLWDMLKGHLRQLSTDTPGLERRHFEALAAAKAAAIYIVAQKDLDKLQGDLMTFPSHDHILHTKED